MSWSLSLLGSSMQVSYLALVLLVFELGGIVEKVKAREGIQVDFSGKSDPASTCIRVRTGKTGILSIGQTELRFMLITTDLYVYDLPLDSLNQHLFPPYKILINRAPVHMSKRFPKSFPVFKELLNKLGNKVLYSWVGGFRRGNASHDYINFVVEQMRPSKKSGNPSNKGCIFSIDIDNDLLISGICSKKLLMYTIVGFEYLTDHNMVPPEGIILVALLADTEEHSRQYLPCQAVIFTEKQGTVLESFGEAEEVIFMWDKMDKETKEQFLLLPPLPHPISFMIYYHSSLHLFDRGGTVHIHQNQLNSNGPQSQKFVNYFGCNEQAPFALVISKAMLVVLIVGSIIVQIAICYCAYVGMVAYLTGDDNDKDAMLKGKRSKRNRRKDSAKRDDGSPDSKSSASRKGSVESKSRKSSASRSRSTSRSRNSPSKASKAASSSRADKSTRSRAPTTETSRQSSAAPLLSKASKH